MNKNDWTSKEKNGIIRKMQQGKPFPKIKRSLLQLLGPSIIFVALSLNGGELLLWPSLTSNFGLKILWAIPIILILQYVVNMEIERYSLVTGKSTEENLVGSVRWLAIVFALTVIITLVWPAWMSTAGNLISTIALPEYATPEISRNFGLVITIGLLLLSIGVFKNRRSYDIIENIAKFGLIAALGIIILTVALNFDTEIFMEGLGGLISWGYLPADMPRFDFLGALAFGGVAGVLNLAQSEWVLDKKYGAAGLSSEEQEQLEFETIGSKNNFKEWFVKVNQEHFLLFFCANLISIFLLAYLGRLLLPIGSASGFAVLQAEIAALNSQIPFLGITFGISGILLFVMANIVILDAIGRLMFRMLKPLNITNKWLTSSNISIGAALLGVLILSLSLVIPALKQPYQLLVISASLSSMVMWLYPPLLLKLNMQLPKATRPGVVRIILLLVCTIFYGWVSIWALSSILPTPVTITLAVLITGYQVYYVRWKNLINSN